MLSRSGQVVYHRALARNFGLRESAGGWRAVGCRACGAPHEHAVAVAALLHALTTFASAPRRACRARQAILLPHVHHLTPAQVIVYPCVVRVLHTRRRAPHARARPLQRP